MAIKEKDKLFSLELIEAMLSCLDIDLKELNNNFYGPYRQIRPYDKCKCWALEPDEELKWHVVHINKCLGNLRQLNDFYDILLEVIEQEAERFSKEKEQIIERIENKAREINYKDKFGRDYKVWKYDIIFLRNMKEVEKEEKKHLTYLENLANIWQKDSEAEKEKAKKQEEERIKQEKQKAQTEEAKKKKQEEETQQKEQVFKEQIKGEKRQKTNPENDKELSDWKNRFYEIYQKEKKYNWTELKKLLYILKKIEKETGLDNDFQDARDELQIIFDKLKPYEEEVFLLCSRGEDTEARLKGLDKYELENFKKPLEEIEKIRYLNTTEECLIKGINDKLKTLNLKEEINQLKSQKTENPQQQEENRKKLAEKEQELANIKEDREKKEKPASQEITAFKNQISQLLQKHNLKTSDLPQKCQNWEKQLKECQNWEQADQLFQEISQQIKNKSKELKQTQNSKKKRQQSLSLGDKVGIGILSIIVILGIIIIFGRIVVEVRKKRKK